MMYVRTKLLSEDFGFSKSDLEKLPAVFSFNPYEVSSAIGLNYFSVIPELNEEQKVMLYVGPMMDITAIALGDHLNDEFYPEWYIGFKSKYNWLFDLFNENDSKNEEFFKKVDELLLDFKTFYSENNEIFWYYLNQEAIGSDLLYEEVIKRIQNVLQEGNFSPDIKYSEENPYPLSN